jgi:flagellar biosynthesis protein FlhF
MPAELQEVHVDLLQQDVEDRIALELVNQLRLDLTGRELGDWGLIRGRLADLIAFRIPTTAAQAPAEAPQGRRVIAFIGPTGVGKTTTIAKLAANFRLKEGKRVGLLTIDTYRIAAVDQLRTYADIIEVPLQAVLTPAELQQAIQSMSQMDVVLIDTAGRSQNNPLRLNQLRGFLAAASPDEVHLVISATANQRCLRSAMDRFCPMGVNRIIMTKFDEAETFGVILTASTAGKGPLSYVTAGQEVPDDIAQADARRLAQAIVEGSMQPVRVG